MGEWREPWQMTMTYYSWRTAYMYSNSCCDFWPTQNQWVYQNSSVYYVNVPFKLPLGCKQCFNIWGFCVFKILCLVCHDDWRDYSRSTIRWRHFQLNIVPMLPMRIPKAVKGRFLRQLWLLTLSHGTSEIFHAPTAKNCIIPRPLSRSTF